MIYYFSSPGNQLQASSVSGKPVLISFGTWSPFLQDYTPTFARLLIDSGAFTNLGGKKKLDVTGYAAWADQWRGHADAIAGLDDISGNWRQSLANYEAVPYSFPTFHDTDPPELLDDLIPMARERGGWLGVGLEPPRHGKEEFLRRTFDRIPQDIHIHGWALGGRYGHLRRMDSTDSTTAWRIAMRYRTLSALKHLTYSECLDISVKALERKYREPPR